MALFSAESYFVVISEPPIFCVTMNKLTFSLNVLVGLSNVSSDIPCRVSVPETEDLLPVIVKKSQCEFLTRAGVAAAESA